MNRTKLASSAAALALMLVMGFEGLRTNAYLDPVDIPTICYGETAGVKLGQVKSAEECQTMLAGRLNEFITVVDNCVHVPLAEYERAALGSFAYNVGAQAFCSSTLARKFNAGDHVGGCNELRRWTRAGGKVLPGLVTRRERERYVCLGGINPNS